VALSALALSTTSCLAIFGGVQTTSVTFPLEKRFDGSFWAWNEITIDQDVNSINSATLYAAKLSITSPAGADFTFLSSLKGEVVGAAGRTLVAKMDTVPPGEPQVLMDVVYFGDLKSLFKDSKTIRLEWSGTTNPAFTNWPAGGYTVEAEVQIDVE
jgi:hypothetical protein